jgi:hypothetical protein
MSTRVPAIRSQAAGWFFKTGARLHIGARYESARRRWLWALVATTVVLVPLAFTLARSTDYRASIGIYPRVVGPYPAVEDPGYWRAFLSDPELRRNMVPIGADAQDLERVEITPSSFDRSLVVTATASTAKKAAEIATALGPQLAGASARQLHARALRDGPEIGKLLQSPKTGRARRTQLRRQLAFIRGLGPFATHRAVVGAPPSPPPLTWADRVANALPGGTPEPPSPAAVVIAGLAVVATLWALALILVPPPAVAAMYGHEQALAPPWVRRAAAILGAESRRPPVVIRVPEVAMPRWSIVGVFGALLLALLFILWVGRGEIFLGDEWDFLVNRRGVNADAWLKPINEHLMVFPVAVFKLLFVTVGANDVGPYRAGVALAHVAVVGLVFIMARRRVGWVIAALLTAPILIFGPGFDVLLFPINLGFAGSLVGGLGMLVALDRGTRRGDVAAGALLLLSLGSSSLGICFAVGLGVELLWRRDRRRAWIFLAPIVLYGIWYLNYNLHPIRTGPLEPGQAPEFAFHHVAASLSALVGLPLGVETQRYGYHRVIELLAYCGVLAAIYLFVRRVTRRGLFTARVAMVVTALIAFYALTGVARAYSGDWYASRYVYPAAVLIVVLIAELTRGVTLSRRALHVAIAAALCIAILNAHWLYQDGSGRRDDTQTFAAELGALDLARQHVPRNLLIDAKRVPWLRAGAYFEATDALGSPALSRAELIGARGRYRSAADEMLVRVALEISPFERTPDRPALRRVLRGSGGRYARPRGRCIALTPPHRPVTAILTVPPQGLAIAASGSRPVSVSLRQLGPNFPSPVATVSESSGAQLVTTYPDRVRRPWIAAVTGAEPFRLC